MEKAGITVVRNLGELGKTTAEVIGMQILWCQEANEGPTSYR
jgi:hypothetical protein